mmetsp:Transcript_2980/g.2457  ORF Transcript_2980/g.2457 Transcript_2980/m.2457 type:complete len:108 (+) Transcript_2980:342-665(+)
MSTAHWQKSDNKFEKFKAELGLQRGISSINPTHSVYTSTRKQSHPNINLNSKFKETEKKLENKIKSNKIITPVIYESVPLCWGSNKHTIRVPKSISRYVQRRRVFSS